MHCNMKTKSQCPPQTKHELISVLIARLMCFLPNDEICVMLECHQDQITTLGSLDWFDLAYCCVAGNEIHPTLSTHTEMKDGSIPTLFWINGSALSQPGRKHKQPHFTLNIGIWTLTSNFGVFFPTSENQCGWLPATLSF